MNLADKSFSTTKLMAIAGATLASVVATMAPAAAVNVTVNGQEYVVNTRAGSFNSQGSLLRAQPWWGSSQRASAFALAVGRQLGLPNWGGSGRVGPFFALSSSGSNVIGNVVSLTYFPGGFLSGIQSSRSNSAISYATATLAAEDPTPVPLESDGWAMLLSTTALGLGVKLKQLKNKKKIDLEK